MNAQAVERITPLFFESQAPKGSLDLNIAFKDLTWPVQKIPDMKGFVRVNNGFLEASMVCRASQRNKPERRIQGRSSEMLVKRIVCGQTTVGNSKLHLEGEENPRFSLSVSMDTFNLNDFRRDSEFALRSIAEIIYWQR